MQHRRVRGKQPAGSSADVIRRRIIGLPASILAVGLAACGGSDVELVREAARAACAATLQTLYRPMSEKEPVTFERIADTAADAGRFEFNWKRSQISGLMWDLLQQEFTRENRSSPGDGGQSYRIVIEGGGAEPEPRYICKGSLKVRSMHGLWLQKTDARGQVRDIRLTQHPISF